MPKWWMLIVECIEDKKKNLHAKAEEEKDGDNDGSFGCVYARIYLTRKHEHAKIGPTSEMKSKLN